jgi:ATP-dependent metalloprotease
MCAALCMLGTSTDSFLGPLKPDFSSKNRFPPERPKTRLSDVLGCDEAKAEVVEVIEYLKDPSRFNRLGGKMPKGVLLLGPPGTGKTLLARAIAGEADVPFFAATGADFEEMFVGVGAKRVRELFAAAKKVKPSIVFIDELDTVGGKRNEFDNPKTRMSLNQILTELDGFHESTGVIIMGATNYAEKLDPALLRPGRFDRHVTVAAPDIKGRKAVSETRGWIRRDGARCMDVSILTHAHDSGVFVP